ncbi:MAG: RND transporter [Archangium gephyra]|uniref:RND transporter n=1 Tax=Archangium gephyra TaxID=48 RepID=A0A2W5VB86_9BACT|nr:MAG: RND transporter [Archangium gephyra]
MWLVRLALSRPYTFVVLALLLVIGGVNVIRRTPTDLFPNVDIPVINAVWSYQGLSAQQMEQQITLFSEFSLAGNVSGIKKIESTSFDGVAVIRMELHEGEDVGAATAQVTAASQTILRRMPPGTQPPVIVRSSATSVPILQIAATSDTASEAEIFDFVNLRVRSAMSAVRGTRFPLPMGGKTRQIVVDVEPEQLKARGLSVNEVATAVAQQNLTLPTGSAKLGDTEFRVSTNASPEVIDSINELPIRLRDGSVLRVRDVAFAHDGFAPQTTIARYDGNRAVVLSVLKTGDASTIAVANDVKNMLPALQASAPPGLKLTLLADESQFVVRSIESLLMEGLIATLLTATMILVFLGSWRSTLIIFISIPLSILSTLVVMRAMGHTINTMVLGGLALAVGILVDDATVEIENIHRNLAMGKPLTRAILDGARQVAVPAFVAALSIALVFAAVFFLEGPAKYLFVPMGLAVGLSVLSSYLLSRTIVPTLVKYLIANEQHGGDGWFARFHHGFEARFEKFRLGYVALLEKALAHRGLVLVLFGAAVAFAGALATRVGEDFFPRVDGGQLRLHVSAPAGTRLEETERHFARVEDAVRELVPPDELELLLAQIGLPSGYSLAVSDSTNTSSSDGELLVRFRPHRTKSTTEYQQLLREQLAERFPELSFYFAPGDIVTQVINFGLPSPISVQLTGQKRVDTLAAARKVVAQLQHVPGIVDVRLHQVLDAPRLHLDVDRQRAASVGLSLRDVANDVLLTVSSSAQVAPNFWTDPVTLNSYPVVVQTPEVRVDSVDALSGLGLSTPRGVQLLGDLATLERKTTPVFTSHVEVQPTYEVRADVAWLDLGSVAGAVEKIADDVRPTLPPGSKIFVRGQVDGMRQAFGGLFVGLALAVLLVYGLMVINFQSWLDPFVMLLALPGAAVGIVVALFLTGTTFSVSSLMGAVMSIGVATANSTLLVSFANEARLAGNLSAIEAALEAGRTRLRPVIMTAMAMVLGMAPMALNHGEGGEQNAALARAVIGGLFGATTATLFLVPVMYSVLKRKVTVTEIDPDLAAPEPMSEGA